MGPGKWHSPPCTTEHSGRTKCSAFYHDLEQTPVADRASARVQDGAWYIYHELNDVSGLSPGYRSITAGPVHHSSPQPPAETLGSGDGAAMLCLHARAHRTRRGTRGGPGLGGRGRGSRDRGTLHRPQTAGCVSVLARPCLSLSVLSRPCLPRPDTATWAGCRAAAAAANRTIFTWWNTSGTSGRCWFSSEWSTPPKPGTTSTLPVHEAGHVTGYRPAHGEAPPAVAVDPNTCVSGDCDCGDDIPCGEYLWDHRNQSLRTWLLDVFILGAGSALGNPAIDGFYFDDSWRSKAVPSPQPPPGSVMHSCDASPIGGATEENPFCAVDMGLTRQDVVDITSNWTLTRKMTAAALLKAKGFGWGSDSMFAGTGARAVVNDIGGATGSMDPRPKCAADLRRACAANSTWHDGALLFEFTRATFAKPFPLPYVQQDVAMFLLARGPYAWLGHNWMGCVDEALVRPKEIDVDYGTPVDERCVETRTGSGVFTRKWTTGTVMMDCNRWIGTLPAA